MKSSGGDLADMEGDLSLVRKPSAALIEPCAEPLGRFATGAAGQWTLIGAVCSRGLSLNARRSCSHF